MQIADNMSKNIPKSQPNFNKLYKLLNQYSDDNQKDSRKGLDTSKNSQQDFKKRDSFQVIYASEHNSKQITPSKTVLQEQQNYTNISQNQKDKCQVKIYSMQHTPATKSPVNFFTPFQRNIENIEIKNQFDLLEQELTASEIRKKLVKNLKKKIQVEDAKICEQVKLITENDSQKQLQNASASLQATQKNSNQISTNNTSHNSEEDNNGCSTRTYEQNNFFKQQFVVKDSRKASIENIDCYLKKIDSNIIKDLQRTVQKLEQENIKQKLELQDKEKQLVKKTQEVQQVCQEKQILQQEIVYLQKNKEKLETSLKETTQSEKEKCRSLELQLQDKIHKIQDLQEQMNKQQLESKLSLINIKEKTETQTQEQDDKIKKLLKAVDNYKLLEQKIVELEQIQQQMISENDLLKKQINIYENDTRYQKDQLKETTAKHGEVKRHINCIEMLIQRFVTLTNCLVKSEEPPLDLLVAKGKKCKQETDNLANMEVSYIHQMMLENLKQNCKQLEDIQQKLRDISDEICDFYMRKLGNQCNVQ